jgi:hypothetical protein
VIRFRCSSERIDKFGGSFFWEMKCHPVCPFSIILCTPIYIINKKN